MRTWLTAGTVLVFCGGIACRDKPVAIDDSLARDLGRAASVDTTGLVLARVGGQGQQVTSAIEQVRAKPTAHAPVPHSPQPTLPNVETPHISITPSGSTPEPTSASQTPSLQRGTAGVSLGNEGQGRVKIRVSQETRPGAGNFDDNVLGFVSALNTEVTAANFYQYGLLGPNYGGSVPKLTANTSHLFFVNTSEGLTLFVVHHTSHRPLTPLRVLKAILGVRGDGSSDTRAKTQFDVLGGTPRLLLSDDPGEATVNGDGTSFTGDDSWTPENTDGMVIGPLSRSSTIIGQFTEQPTGVDRGWEVISGDGSIVHLHLVPGRRIRLDFN